MWLQFKLRGEEVKDRYLFRGRVLKGFRKEGQFITGFYTWCEDNSFINCHESVLIDADTNSWENHLIGYNCDPETIGQCTGLKDKNGKLIFEGDIMRLPDGVTQVVKWSDDYLHFALYDKDKQRGHILIEKDDEIIGNIHDGN